MSMKQEDVAYDEETIRVEQVRAGPEWLKYAIAAMLIAVLAIIVVILVIVLPYSVGDKACYHKDCSNITTTSS